MLYAAVGVGSLWQLLLVIAIGLLISRPDHQTRQPDPIAKVYPEPQYSPPPPPTPVLSPEPSTSLAWLEDATVFIKIKVGHSVASGTGFVIRVKGDTALIATNRHVVTPDLDEDEGKPEIKVVFRSGKGPGQEQELAAELVAADTAEELNHDLAILKVRGLSRTVRPVELSRIARPGLGMKYSA